MNKEYITFTVSEIDADGFIEEIETFNCIEKAYELKLALCDADSFLKGKAQYEVLAHKCAYGKRI